RGFCAERSRTHPYECFRVGKLWVMRDAPRKNPKNYRKEEWVPYGVNAGDSTWCSNMYVRPSHRRRGIGSALLTRMLRDDRARGFKKSVLLSSHTGALVYPRVGYEQIGLLLIFAPKK